MARACRVARACPRRACAVITLPGHELCPCHATSFLSSPFLFSAFIYVSFSRESQLKTRSPLPRSTFRNERELPGESQKPDLVSSKPSEEALDNGIEESFPASDPLSVNVTKVRNTH